MSHPLHELPTEELTAEIQRRKGAEVQALRDEITEHRKAIAALEAKIAAHNGEKAPKATRTRSVKIDPAEAEDAVLKSLAASDERLPASQIAERTGINGAHVKAALERLEAAGKVHRSGKARGTVYGVYVL